MSRGDGIEIEIDGDYIFAVAMSQGSVRAAVQQRATDIAARARRIDQKDGAGRANIRVEKVSTGTGRVAYNVVSDDIEGEYGSSTRARLSTLRRARGGR